MHRPAALLAFAPILLASPAVSGEVPVAGTGETDLPSEQAGAAEPGEDGRVHEFVPRNVRVSVTEDRLWVSARTEVAPADLGEASWAAWDRDSDGRLSGPEAGALESRIRADEFGHLCVAVDEVVLPVLRMGMTREEPQADPIPLDARIVLRIEGQTTLDLGMGEHGWTLYDRPRGLAGVVPFRLALGPGLALVSSAGARAEVKGPRRVDAVVSRFAPAAWGKLSRSAPAPLGVATPAPAP